MITFSQSDVNAWLRFCGDTNPLHFNIQKASNAGFSEPIVPGMLLAMPIKSRIFTPVADGQIRLFFKKAALIGATYQINKHNNDVQLIIPDSGNSIITGRIGMSLASQSLEHDIGVSILKGSEINACLLSIPSLTTPALWAEALIFRDLINKLKTMVLWGKSGSEILSSGALLHLSNTVNLNKPVTTFPEESRVYFSAALVTSPLPGWAGHLHCRANTECGRVLSEHIFGVKR